MKFIKYNICTKINRGTVKDPVYKDFLDEIIIEYSEANKELAKKESYNGEYTIEDDGQPDSVKTPTQLDIIEAQVTYTAMMTDTLLEV